jgi:hypothetical protein
MAGAIPAQAGTSPGWRVAHLFTNRPLANLLGLTATGPADAWAFGDGQHHRPTAVHWDGHTWTATRLAGATGRPSYTSSTSATNVWAAGSGACGTAPRAPFVSRWNGTQWTTKLFSRISMCVSAVVTTGPTDGWLFGSQGTGGVALHYNGTTWRMVPLHNPGPVVAAWGVSATDVWALMYTPHDRMVAEQWNGRIWASVPLNEPALPSGYHAYPMGISATGAGNVWATAQLVHHNTEVTGPDNSYVLHWDGQGWQWTPLPNSDMAAQVAPDGASGAWLVAYTNPITGAAAFMHFTGGQWAPYPIPHKRIPGTGVSAEVYALALIPGTQSLLATADVYYNTPTQSVTNAVVYQYGP